MKLRLERRPLALSSLLLLGLCGCYQVLGLGDYKAGAGGSGGASSSESGAGTGSASPTATGSTSTGGGSCTPNSNASCYSGPTGTEGNGICKAGQKTCNANGMGYMACVGEVLPAPETCTNIIDDDCDGNECAEWSNLFGDATDQTVSGVAVDSQGNLLVAGTFTGSLAFDPANPITANGTQVYLAKFDKQGVLVWNKVFASTFLVTSSGVAVDGQDNVLISGIFDHTINFGAGPLTSPAVDNSSYVAKFSSAGTPIFSTVLSFDPFTEVVPPASDSAGNVILFGTQESDPDVTATSVSSLWLEKRGPTGTLIWHKKFAVHAPPYPTAAAVQVDPFDNIVIGGSFAGSETLGAAAFSSAGGSVDALVGKFNSAGTLVDKVVLGDSAAQSSTGIGIDSVGDVFVTGTYAGSIQFGSTISSAGSTDIFVGRVLGGTAWLKSFGDAAKQTGGSISVSHSGAPVVIFTGSTQGNVDYGGGVLTGAGGLDIPLVKLDASGAHVWSRLFGDAADQAGTGIALLNNGESVMTANVKGGLNVGAGLLTSKGGFDVLLARFAP